MARGKFDLEKARAWANSGKDRPPLIASKETTERHQSEWQGVKVVTPAELNSEKFSPSTYSQNKK